MSINAELTEAEAALTRLCEAIQCKTASADARKEFHTLCNQATGALNKMRSISETTDWFSNGGPKKILDNLK